MGANAKKRLTKILSAVLAIAVILGTIPMYSFAKEVRTTGEPEYFSVQVLDKNGFPVENSVSCVFNCVDGTGVFGSSGENGLFVTDYKPEDILTEEGTMELFLEDDYDNPIDVTVSSENIKNKDKYIIAKMGEKNTARLSAYMISVLKDVDPVSEIKGVAFGTDANAAAMGLPEKVSVTTSTGKADVDVTWDLSKYDSSLNTIQTFEATGKLEIPENIVVKNARLRQVTAKVTVDACENAKVTIKSEAGDTVNVGQSVILEAVLERAKNGTVKWYKGSVSEDNLKGTADTLKLDNVKMDDAGTYICEVEGLDGVTVSSTFTLKVNKNDSSLAISADPEKQTRPAGAEIIVKINKEATGTVKVYYSTNSSEFKDFETINLNGNSEYRTSAFKAIGADNKYKFKAEYSGDDKFNPAATAEMNYDFQKGDQSAPSVKGTPRTDVKYNTDTAKNTFTVTAEGGNGTGAYVFEIFDQKDLNNATVDNVATIDNNGKVVYNRSGKFKIRVKKLGDNDYNDSTYGESGVVTVKKADQEGFRFKLVTNDYECVVDETAKNAVKYGANGNKFVRVTEGGNTTNAAVYSIKETKNIGGNKIDETVAEINAETGELTIKRSGIIVVQAKKPGDEKYNDAIAEYTLEIQKADITIEFATPEPGIVDYGIDTYENPIATSIDDDAKITYSITSGATIASINALTGVLTFNPLQSGAVTVKAVMEETEKYNKATATYTITVDEIKTVSFGDYAKIEGTLIDGWYKDSITIKSINSDYTLSTNPKAHKSWDFKDSVKVNKSIDEDFNLKIRIKPFLQRARVTDSTMHLRIDNEAPDEKSLNVSFKYTTIKNILGELFSFGNYEPQVEVVFSAHDDTSGIKKFEWIYNNIDGDDIENGTYTFDTPHKDAEYTLKLSYDEAQQFKGKFILKAYDVVNHVSELTSDTTLVIDSIAPEISEVKYEGSLTKENAGIDVYSSDVNVTVTIDEKNFYPENTVIKVNDSDKFVNAGNLEWKNVDGSNQATFTLKCDDNKFADYTVNISHCDNSGNSDTYEKTIVIDKKAPVVNVTAPTGYINTDGELTIVIDEHNFDAAKVTANISAKDCYGNDIKKSELEELQNYIHNEDNWNENGDVRTITVPLYADAIYSGTVTCEDMANHSVTSKEFSFVADATAIDEDSITVKYSSPITWTLIKDYFNPDITVTVTAEQDNISKIKDIILHYRAASDASDVDKKTEDIKLSEKDFDIKDDGKTVVAEFKLKSSQIGDQYNGNAYVEVVNYAGLKIDKSDDPTKTFVVDTLDPERTVIFEHAKVLDLQGNDVPAKEIPEYEKNDNVVLYYADSATVKIQVDEANFVPSDINAENPVNDAMDCTLTVSKDGVESKVNPTDWKKNGDVWTGTINLSGDGVYVVHMTYYDRSLNEMDEYTSPEIHLDTVPPEISVEYRCDVPVVNGKYYQAERTATISVKEDNFLAKNVDFKITAKNINGKDVKIDDFGKQLKDQEKWKFNDGFYTAEIIFEEDAIYNFTIDCTDVIGLKAETYTAPEFIVDKTKPVVTLIDYDDNTVVNEVASAITFGYYKPSATVIVSATDETSGVLDGNLVYTREEGASSINVDTQKFEPVSIKQDPVNKEKFVITYNIPADEEHQYRGIFDAAVTDNAGWTSETVKDDDYVAVIDTISPTRTVSFSDTIIYDAETMTRIDSFKEGDKVKLYHKNAVTLTFDVDEANFYPEDINASNPISTKMENCLLTVTKDGKESKVNPKDWARHDDHIWTGSITLSGDGDYTTHMEYNDRSDNKFVVDYNSPEVRIDSVPPKIHVDYKCDAEVVNGKYYSAPRKAIITVDDHNFLADFVDIEVTALDITGEPVPVDDYAAQLKDRSKWNQVGENSYQTTIVFDKDANYSFKLGCTDIIGNVAEVYSSGDFTVDKTKPDASKINIEYSQSLVSKVISAITFGYYNPDVTVTVTAEDITSGIKDFQLTYTKENGASDKNVETEKFAPLSIQQNSADKKTYTAIFKLPSSEVNQYRGNFSVVVTDFANLTSDSHEDKDNIIVIDNIDPKRKVEFSPAKQVVDAETLLSIDSYDYYTEGSEYKLYYDGDATASIVIDEANFYPEDVKIKVNDVDYAVSGWTTDKDIHTAKVVLSGEGHYVIKMSYIDRSNNKMTDYTSNEIIIDTTNPSVKVTYSPDKVIRTRAGVTYYNDVQTATIVVKEDNFRADDIAAAITAKNVAGENVDVTDFAKYLRARSSWTSKDGFNTAVITYSKDANYTFDIDYKDLALRQIPDFNKDSFTVDKTAPTNLRIEYSTSVLERVLESVTFGFYNAQMTVGISADDETAGINDFVYSYVKARNVSSVNAELINQAISEAGISYSNGGKTATSSFKIPKYTLSGDNQFRGTVKFTANDRSDNKSEKVDTRTVVVDNIAPTAVITYNQPVSTSNGTSYYAGNITATIRITEANFFPEDVQVMVNNQARSVTNWTQSGDTWQGTIVISGDGNYIVTVAYRDRSQNAMANYKSNQLVIDATKPVITLNGIANQSAYKADKIGFVLQATDTNFRINDFKPVLTAVYRKPDGSFGSKAIDLGAVRAVTAGKTYQYVVDNLEEDAIYTLSCSVADMSGNSTNVMTVTESKNAQLQQVVFSINRNGSTYEISKYTNDVKTKYFNQNITEDIQITEINVDPLKSYKVELNGKELTEGKDYKVAKTENAGTWCKYVYMISKSLFKNEGEYSIVISSTDKTDSKSFNDMKDAKLEFVVDRSKPQILVTGLKSGGIYKTDKQTVTMTVTDDGGRISSLKVVIKDENGNIISTPVELSGEELLEVLSKNSNKITFEVSEKESNQNIELICFDEAGNQYNSNTDYYNVTVSSNRWITFWANPLYRWGTIGGAVAIAAGIFFIIFFKRRKDDDEEEEAAQ